MDLTAARDEWLQRKQRRAGVRRQFAAARAIGLARRYRERENRIMAEKAKRDPFEPWLNGFNYDMAFDGSAWTISKGEDFDQAATTVAAKLREEYTRRYGALDIKVEGDIVHVRRTAPTR